MSNDSKENSPTMISRQPLRQPEMLPAPPVEWRVEQEVERLRGGCCCPGGNVWVCTGANQDDVKKGQEIHRLNGGGSTPATPRPNLPNVTPSRPGERDGERGEDPRQSGGGGVDRSRQTPEWWKRLWCRRDEAESRPTEKHMEETRPSQSLSTQLLPAPQGQPQRQPRKSDPTKPMRTQTSSLPAGSRPAAPQPARLRPERRAPAQTLPPQVNPPPLSPHQRGRRVPAQSTPTRPETLR